MPEDYVKRQDVHKVFQPKYAPAINRTFAAMIDSVPAADVVEVRHGRWMVAAVNLHFNSVCSACGENFYSPLRGAYIVHHAKYCPNCGAKMDGGQDNE